MYAGVMGILRERGVVRSANGPVADYAEGLVARALSLTPLPRSTKGCDALDAHGKRYEIKSRRVTKQNKSSQLSFIRNLDACHFDYLVGVLFDEDFAVRRACVIPHSVSLAVARYNQHVNGSILHLRPTLWERAEVRDVTDGGA